MTENSTDRSRRRAPSRWLFGVVAVACLALDQITKHLAVSHLDPADPPSFLGGLVRLQLIRNSGAAFSLGENYTIVFTILASLVLIFVLAVLLPRLGHIGWAFALGLLAAGVAGNLTDRIFRPPSVFHGHVVDFIQLPHFAIFNVADMCVTGAAILIVILAIFRNVAVNGDRYPRTGHKNESATAGSDEPEAATKPEPDAGTESLPSDPSKTRPATGSDQ
ncbi:MAG TPA: signal peptidase II [Microlunatus sp.]